MEPRKDETMSLISYSVGHCLWKNDEGRIKVRRVWALRIHRAR